MTPSTHDDLARPRQLAVAARLGGEVDDHRAGPHAAHRRRRDQPRRGAAGDRAVVITTSEPAMRSSSCLLLLRLLLRRQLARVAALGLLAGHAEVDELRAEALDLLPHDRPHVEAGHDRAEPAAVAIACSPATPAPSTSTFAGRDRAGRGHQHREEARQAVGGDQRRLVAGDRRLRRERVHRLRARDARDRLHRERDDAALGEQTRRRSAVGQRLQERDQD